MDRITQSFLNEFVERHELGVIPEGQQFENFASYVAVRRHYNGESFDTTTIHTGGGGDLGIDGLAILVNGSLVADVDALNEHADISGHYDASFVFIQADRGSSFDGKKLSDFGFGVKDFFDPQPKLVRNEQIQAAAEAMEALYKDGTKFRPGNPICRLYYVTTGTWTGEGDLEARRKTLEDDLRSLQIFREVEVLCLGAAELQQLYRQTKNAIIRDFTFTQKTLLPDIEGVNEAYIGFLPLSEFLKIIQDDSGEILGSLFSENVRDWQQYTTSVNDEIRQTVVSQHADRFVVMNNGITMIARNLTPLRRDQIQIEDFQIVNGCQTTSILFDQRNQAGDNIHVPIRLIATQDDEVIKAIVRGTNRQTKVEDDQFFALTDFADQLEDFFETYPELHKVYYERRSGQYARKSIHTTRVVPHRSLVKLVASMFMEVPHQASRRYTALRENVGREIFSKGQRLEMYYVAAFGNYKLDVNFRTGRVSKKLKPAKFHILLAMRYLANPNPLPQKNSRDMEAYCKVIADQLWDSSKADDLCARAAILVEQVADENFKKDAEGNFNRDDIRGQAFTERVILRCKEEIGLTQQ